MADGIVPDAPLPAVDYEAVEAFLADLRREGLHVGAREEIACARLLSELIARGAVKTASDLRPFLQPLLARNEDESARFARVFHRWFESAEGPAPPEPVPTPEASRKRGGWGWVGPTLLAVLALGVFAWFALEPPPEVPVAPPGIVDTPPIPPKSAETPEAPPANLDAAEVVGTVLRAANFLPAAHGAPTIRELGTGIADEPAEGALGVALGAYGFANVVGPPFDRPQPVLEDAERLARIAQALAFARSPAAVQPSTADFVAAAREQLAARDTTSASVEQRLVYAFTVAPTDPTYEALAQQVAAFPTTGVIEFEGVTYNTTPPSPLQRGLELWNQRNPSLAVAYDDPNRLDDTPAWLAATEPQRAPLWAPYAAALAPLLLLIIWLGSSLERRKAFLRRRAPDYPPALHELVSRGARSAPKHEAVIHRAAQHLQQWGFRQTDRLDVPRTLDRSLANGRFSPVYAHARAQPSYLVLIETAGVGDQEAARMRGLVRRLEARHIEVDLFFFQNDPAWLHPEVYRARDDAAPFATPPVSLEELLHRFPQHRLLVLGGGESLIDPLSGEPRSSALLLREWEARAMLTPRPLAEWGAREFSIARRLGVPLGRATAEGLLALSGLLGLDGAGNPSAISFEGDGKARGMPRELRARLDRWTTDMPASSVSWDELRRQLLAYLGSDGLAWLSACAVYPELRWDLTLFLGLTVKRLDGEPVYDEDRLAALTQLPWFRLGRMPDWLRGRLITELSDRAQAVRAALAEVVEAAKMSKAGPEDAEAIRLRIATAERSAGDVMEDQIFLDFLARGDVTDLEVGWLKPLGRLAPKQIRQGMDKSGLVVLGVGLLAIVLALLTTPVGGKLGLADIYGRVDGSGATVDIWFAVASLVVGLAALLVVDRRAIRIRADKRVTWWAAMIGDVGWGVIPWLLFMAGMMLVGEPVDAFWNSSLTSEPAGYALFFAPAIIGMMFWRYRIRSFTPVGIMTGLVVVLGVGLVPYLVLTATRIAPTISSFLLAGVGILLLAHITERVGKREAPYEVIARQRRRRLPKARPLLASVNGLVVLALAAGGWWWFAATSSPLPPGASRADVTAETTVGGRQVVETPVGGRHVVATRLALWSKTQSPWTKLADLPVDQPELTRIVGDTNCLIGIDEAGALVKLTGAAAGERAAVPGASAASPAAMTAWNGGALLFARVGEANASVMRDPCAAGASIDIWSSTQSSTGDISPTAATTAMLGDGPGFIVGDARGRVWTVMVNADDEVWEHSGIDFAGPVQSIEAEEISGIRRVLIRSAGMGEVVAAWTDGGKLEIGIDRRVAPEVEGFDLVSSAVDTSQAAPRACFTFSAPLDPAVDYRPFFSMAPAPQVALSVEGSNLCFAGLDFETAYSFTLRAGLPAADGRTLADDRTMPVDTGAITPAAEAARREAEAREADDQDWRVMSAIGTEAAYDSYLQEHPKGLHVAEAQEAKARLGKGRTPDPPPPTTQTAAVCAAQPAPFVVYFEWDRSDLTSVNRDTINAAVTRARTGGCEILVAVVEGHTDSSGSAVYAMQLSQRQTNVVRDALIAAGVPASVIQTVAKGESEPAEPRPDGTREPLNRRAEIQLVIGRGSAPPAQTRALNPPVRSTAPPAQNNEPSQPN